MKNEWGYLQDTQDFLKLVHSRIEKAKEYLVSNASQVDSPSERIAHKALYYSGYLSGLKELIHYIEEAQSDDESNKD